MWEGGGEGRGTHLWEASQHWSGRAVVAFADDRKQGPWGGERTQGVWWGGRGRGGGVTRDTPLGGLSALSGRAVMALADDKKRCCLLPTVRRLVRPYWDSQGLNQS